MFADQYPFSQHCTVRSKKSHTPTGIATKRALEQVSVLEDCSNAVNFLKKDVCGGKRTSFRWRVSLIPRHFLGAGSWKTETEAQQVTLLLLSLDCMALPFPHQSPTTTPSCNWNIGRRGGISFLPAHNHGGTHISHFCPPSP